jgi:peptidylprolyl isomerase
MAKKKQKLIKHTEEQKSFFSFRMNVFLGVIAFALLTTLLLILLNYCCMADISNPQSSNTTIVVFETTKGTFEIELFDAQMPITTSNFKTLVQNKFYDGTRFHRVIKDFMIQGGDPLSKNLSLSNRWGTGGSKPIKDEFAKGLSNKRGTIAMANAGPNTGSSQFFVNVVNNNYLDGKHPVFGKVVSGMDVVDAISLVSTTRDGKPLQEVVLTRVYLK